MGILKIVQVSILPKLIIDKPNIIGIKILAGLLENCAMT